MQNKVVNQVDESWRDFFALETQKPYMQTLRNFLIQRKRQGRAIFPPSDLWFNAFYQTPFRLVKVVIIGQDPYHGAGQAHGLSFSVPKGVDIPPSLNNIFRELQRDIQMPIPSHGNLQYWAQQGVFLLNSVLTVEQACAASHANQGWEQFTQAAIHHINQHKDHVVFLAWGRHAHRVCANIDTSKHLLIKTSHPSPLGAHRSGHDFAAFNQSGCFSQANQWLAQQNIATIDWRLGYS